MRLALWNMFVLNVGYVIGAYCGFYGWYPS